jgi:hypothetical protein
MVLIEAIVAYVQEANPSVPTSAEGPEAGQFPFVDITPMGEDDGDYNTGDTYEGFLTFQTTVAALDPVEAEAIGVNAQFKLMPSSDGGGPPISWDDGRPGREIGRYPGGTRTRVQHGAGPDGATIYYYDFDITLIIQRSMRRPVAP